MMFFNYTFYFMEIVKDGEKDSMAIAGPFLSKDEAKENKEVVLEHYPNHHIRVIPESKLPKRWVTAMEVCFGDDDDMTMTRH